MVRKREVSVKKEEEPIEELSEADLLTFFRGICRYRPVGKWINDKMIGLTECDRLA